MARTIKDIADDAAKLEDISTSLRGRAQENLRRESRLRTVAQENRARLDESARALELLDLALLTWIVLRARTEARLDGRPAQSGVGHRDKNFPEAGDLLDGADHPVGKRTVAGDDRARRKRF